MAKATFVKKARKDIPQANIKAGESYYWWKFRYGGKHYSKTPPRPSQLTSSEFWSTLYAIQEEMEDRVVETKEDFDSLKDEIISQLTDLRDTCEERLSNMPDHLQEVGTGEILTNRISSLEDYISEIENVECYYDEDELAEEVKSEEFEEDEEIDNEKVKELVQKKIEEILSDATSELMDITYDGE
jgi:ATP:corrinoid adenosyltransferase